MNLPFLLPDQMKDSLHAYQLSKRSNSLRVMAEAVRWGRRGARINAISPGIIITPLAKDELAGPRGEGYRRMIELSPARGAPARRTKSPMSGRCSWARMAGSSRAATSSWMAALPPGIGTANWPRNSRRFRKRHTRAAPGEGKPVQPRRRSRPCWELFSTDRGTCAARRSRAEDPPSDRRYHPAVGHLYLRLRPLALPRPERRHRADGDGP